MHLNIKAVVNEKLNFSKRNDVDLDVAVVGGGVSGLYTAWRLACSDLQRKPAVQVFEMGDRIGGRLESVTLPGMSFAGELGGMRYMDAHEMVSSLINKVFMADLKPMPFPMGIPATLYFYARGQRCRQDAWTSAQGEGKQFVTNFFLPPHLVGFDSDQMFNKIIYDVLVADPWFNAAYGAKIRHPSNYEYVFKLTARDWDVIKPRLKYNFDGPYKGMKVNDLGFWNLIRDQAGDESYEFLSVAGGYYSNTINWNAAEAFPYMVGDFSNVDTSYKTIEGGYDRIAFALARAYLETPGSSIWCGNKVECFERMPKGAKRRYRLTVYNVKTGSRWSVLTDKIVLAVPRRSLELLDWSKSSFFFGHAEESETLRDQLESVIMEPSFKLLMGFERPWWRESFGSLAGESLTDLPIRQCYYFGIDPTNGHALFLSSYNDMQTVSFWDPLEPSRNDHLQRFVPRQTSFAAIGDLEPLLPHQATEAMVREAMSQVRLVHGPQQAGIPDPYITFFKDWTKDPFGGGYHAWKAGVDVQKTMQYLRKAREPESVHICGEAYSDQQGWVEGALCVAERMLQEHFGIEWPSWLNREYYLGW
jgi:monoamine oxidase